MLASYLYQHLCKAPAWSAGLDAGDVINDRAEAMLRAWGIDPSAHVPAQLSRTLCNQADGIFVMGPSYLHRLVWEYGEDLAEKAYLFADPFSRPESFESGRYAVTDPSFETRPAIELVTEYEWMRERVQEIRRALLGTGSRLVPLIEYLDLCKTVDRRSHPA